MKIKVKKKYYEKVFHLLDKVQQLTTIYHGCTYATYDKSDTLIEVLETRIACLETLIIAEAVEEGGFPLV